MIHIISYAFIAVAIQVAEQLDHDKDHGLGWF